MIRIIISILIISLMNGSETSAFLRNFVNVDTASSWGDSVLERVLSHDNMIRNSGKTSSSLITTIFTEVDIISDEFDTLLQTMGKKYVERFNKAYDTHHDNTHHHFLKRLEIRDYFNIVNTFYNDARSRHFGFSEISKHKTVEEYFAKLVLQDSVSLPTALEKIHSSIVVSSYYNRISHDVALNDLEKFNQVHTCDKFISTQQSMFFTHVNLLITEMKGLTALLYVYTLLQHMNKASDHTPHLKTAKADFKRRIKNYHDKMNKATVSLSREIHRCEMETPERDINFIEFVDYHQIQLMSASTFGAEKPGEAFDLCNTDCEKIDYSPMANYVGMKIDNVKTVGYNDEITVCPHNGRHRRFWFWISEDQIFGHKKECPDEAAFSTFGYLPIKPHCRTCQLSIIRTRYDENNGGILRISVSPQTSDVKNNMVVVGVKFVAHQNAVHLQIQQGKYSPGEVVNNHTVWKQLNSNLQSDINGEFNYEMLAEFSGQLYLDDVILPPKYAVTGVRFRGRKNAPEGFYLELQGTPLDLATGQLEPRDSEWFSAANRGSSSTLDYRKTRTEIKMTDPDDSSRCSGYNDDRESNKFIRFTHSSLSKDAGQSTVPYIDAQPVETYPSFPLNGVGLFYRGKKGCGGYIAPRIFTFDISS